MTSLPGILSLLTLTVVVALPNSAAAQCFTPGRPAGITWFQRADALHVTWAAAVGGSAATGWTLLLTPLSGTALTFDVPDPRSWTMVAAPPASYRVTVIGRNDCGPGNASEPVRIDTSAPAPAPGIVLNEIGPFVEIFNAGSTTVNLGGWHLYGSAGVDQRVTQGTRIDDLTFVRPGCSLLIGDTPREGGVPVEFSMPSLFGFSTSLALARDDGRVIDQIGRDPTGEASYVPPFGEGTLLAPFATTPLSDTRSYSRVGADTDDNARDLVITSPPCGAPTDARPSKRPARPF